MEPEEITEKRIQQQNMSILEYLIKWKNMPLESATWENEYIKKNPQLQALTENKFLREGFVGIDVVMQC